MSAPLWAIAGILFVALVVPRLAVVTDRNAEDGRQLPAERHALSARAQRAGRRHSMLRQITDELGGNLGQAEYVGNLLSQADGALKNLIGRFK